MKLGIVVVNYRTPLLVVDAIDSLLNDPHLPDETAIIVVDGGSGDGSPGILGRAIAERQGGVPLKFLPLDRNGGFSHANNLGIARLRADGETFDYVLLLNPDTVSRPGAAKALTDFMDAHPQAGIAGSLLEDPDGTAQACAFRFPSPLAEFESEVRAGPVSRLLSRWRVAPDMPDEPTRVDWVSGASLMIRARLFDEIGLMDDGYFLYYEEVDYCRRAARAGWECWHVPASRVVHLVGQSTKVTARDTALPRRPTYWFRSRRRYFVRHHGRAYATVADIAWLAGIGLRRVRRPLQHKTDNDPPHLIRDFLKFNFSMRP